MIHLPAHPISPGPRAWKYHRSAHALAICARARASPRLATCVIAHTAPFRLAQIRSDLLSMISLAWDGKLRRELEDVGVEKNMLDPNKLVRAIDDSPMQLNLSGLGVVYDAQPKGNRRMLVSKVVRCLSVD